MSPFLFDLGLPPLALDCGATIERPAARVWCWTPCDAAARVERAGLGVTRQEPSWTTERRADPARDVPARSVELAPDVPTVVIVHGLTADMRAGGEGGWWGPLIGPGRALDPGRVRLVCVNNLGSCYGSSGPDDDGFPTRAALGPPPPRPAVRGDVPPPPHDAPAPLTTLDQARFLRAALHALGLGRVALMIGGSIGGMITTKYARTWADEVGHAAPVAAFDHTTPWIQAFNHTARQLLRLDGVDPDRALALARQIAHVSYRADEGLWERQGLRQVAPARADAWDPHAPWSVGTYLEHQGAKMVRRFSLRAYLSQLDAMDHHDAREPAFARGSAPGLTAVAIDSDALFAPRWSLGMVERLRAEGVDAELLELYSAHGHDAFLLEWDQLDSLVRRILQRAGLGPATDLSLP